MSSEYKPFKKMLKEHGLHIQVTDGSHYGIYRGSHRIYTMGATPKQAYQAIQNTIRDLVLCKELPNNLVYRGRIYKRKRSEKRLHD